MEKGRDWELNTLVNELVQGKQLVNQLKNQLESQETCEFLVQKIISSYERALSMLKLGTVLEDPQSAIELLEFPHSFSGTNSPRSEDSEREFNDKTQKKVCKKRKTMLGWTEQVRVCAGTGLEVPLDDGHSWRKYGQKDILGAKFPRAYYRCTHRNVQGCLATKQVQRSDQDESIFDITYRGRHTCAKSSHLNPSFESSQREAPNPIQDHHEQSEDMIFNFVTGPEIRTEDSRAREEIFPSFSFPYTSLEVESKSFEDDTFPEPMEENTFMGSYIPPFSTSEANYFEFGMGQFLQTSESDLTDIVSAPTSVPNSPIGDLDFSVLDQVEFDPNFPLNIEFFT